MHTPSSFRLTGRLSLCLLIFTGIASSAHADFIATLQSVRSGKCVDVSGSSQANRANIIQYTCHAGDNQRIRFEQFPDTDDYLLRFQHSEKCLEIPANNTQNGTDVQQMDCHANKNQRWRIEDLGNDEIRLVQVQSGKVLDVAGGSTADQADIQQWDWANVPQQRWTLVNQQAISENPATEGQWSAVIEWPHIPVSAAALPDGRIVTWSSNEKTSFPVQDQMTFSSVYDPQNNSFTDMNNTRHDMFCAGISMLQDGSVLASGGNPNLQHSSIFDIDNNTWTAAPFMNQTRWYGTSLSLSSGEVFATFAKAANEIPEIFTPGAGWTELPDAHMQDLLNEQNQVNAAAVNGATTAQWYAYMHVAPDGRVFHPGPTKTMHWFETDGTGSVTSAGLRNGETRHRQFGSSIMYDVGKLLVSGGADKSQNPASTASALTIDINGATPVVSATAPMSASRTNHDAIVLPNGEVLIVGGNSNGILFNDADSIMHAEIWNPAQGQWRTLDRLNIPRNYHSIGILLQDGRVLAAGGGLCGNCTANHQDGQIFSPPYLFNANGNLATRPSITQAPAGTLAAGIFEVQTDSAIQHFSMIRLSGVTHSINTDQRYLPIDFDSLGNNRYRLSMHENPNVMIPGNYWLFALNAQGVPSWGQLINVGTGIANNPPTVTNPGTQSGAVGDNVSLLISSFDPDGDSLSYSAAGLPQGLSMNSVNGRITGTLQSAITATVTVTVFDGENTREIDFVWQVEDVDINTAPTLSNPGAQTHTVGDTVDLLLIAADDEGDTLSFSAENLPDGVTLNAQTGRITGTPTQDQQVSTRVSVSDGQASTTQTFSWTISPTQPGGTPLNDGDSDRNTVAFQQWQFYTIDAPANIDRVTIQLGDLTADADLYVRANTPPSGHEDNGGVFDCKSTNSGTIGEICQVENTQATTWHIGVHGYAAADYTVSARLREMGDNTGNDTPISSGQVIEGDLSQGDWHFYTVQSAASDVQINASLTALNADLDLYVRAGERPSGPASAGGSYDCQSILGGTSSERCELQNTDATTWYIGVHAYASGSYTLEVTLVDGGDSGDDITLLTLGTEVNDRVAQDAWDYYAVDVPASEDALVVKLLGLNADADLYVRESLKPSGNVAQGGQYDCGSYLGGTNTETCELREAGGKRYIIGVYGYQAADYRLRASIDNGVLEITDLSDGQAVSDRVEQTDWRYYRMTVPAGQTRLSVTLDAMTADGDLYVRQGQVPSGNPNSGANSDCYSVRASTSAETCVVSNSEETDWYIGIYGYQSTDFTVTATSSNDTRLAVHKLTRVNKGERIKQTLSDDASQSGGSGGGSAGGGSVGLLALLALSLLGVARRRHTR